ncbi:MAG: di-trans,poly-cis-decaprenylcistransferase [Candidatus Magasanikbacteria bacterium]|nr:di-trans,poly-cis-decaprenylcistransferase [Candidatus Magasanikbacteria bacterium]
MPTPHHIVFIPDGNRRWAKRQGKPAFFGHRAGFKAVETIFESAMDRGIPYITIWGCSIDNITKRDPKEIAFLYKTFTALFKRLAASQSIRERGVRIRALGRWRDYFPPDLQRVINLATEKTKENSSFHLTLLLAYNGNEEMLSAIQKIAKNKEPITLATVKNSLYTRDLPPVDLVVRTGGDPHFSNGFMMWDIQNAELYFTDKMWPEFTPAELNRALAFYTAAGRRGGK